MGELVIRVRQMKGDEPITREYYVKYDGIRYISICQLDMCVCDHISTIINMEPNKIVCSSGQYQISISYQGEAIRVRAYSESNGNLFQGEITGKTIRFAALPALSPKARAVWKVKVRGLKEYDVRFKTVLTTDQTTSPVEETESTHIYE